MSIPPRFLNELRDRLSLSEIIGKRVKLTRAGREFKGCCPFHNEKTPSFTVNDDKQFYHCFGCGAHGDVINFAMQHDNLSFIEAIEQLAAQAGLQMPEQTPQDIKKAREEKNLYTLMDEVTSYFEQTLQSPEGDVARNYMDDRGMGQSLRENFRVGFAPADRHAMIKLFKDKGYSDHQLMEAGLVRKSKRDGSLYAFFRDRIMFPVMDLRGRIVAFGGRILPDHLRPPDTGDYTPAKYMNSGDTAIFHKGRTLYGEAQARQAAHDGHTMLVVEGYVDVMACVEAGFRGAVAPMGTALTDDQILKLWKMIPSDKKNPVLCFDGDNAGRRAAFRAAENILPLLKPNHSAKIAFLPDGQDPDSLIKAKGAQAFRAVLESALPLVEFLWTHYTAQQAYDTPEERAGLSQTFDDLTSRIADRSVQNYYKQAFREKQFQFFRSQRSFNQGGNQGGNKGGNSGFKKGKWDNKPQVQVSLMRPAVSKLNRIAQIIMSTVINHPQILEKLEDEFMAFEMPDRMLQAMRDDIISAYADNPDIQRADLIAELKAGGYESNLDSLLSNVIYTHAGFAKPETDISDVLSGWENIVTAAQDQAVETELRGMKQELMQNLSLDSEERMISLKKMGQKTDD